MKSFLLMASSVFALVSLSSIAHGEVVSLASSNSEVVLAGDANSYVTISVGETHYFGIPYVGTWSYTGFTSSMQVTNFLFSNGSAGSYSVNFYGEHLGGGPIAAVPLFTAGTGTIPADADPADAATTASITYSETSGNPFGSYSGNYIWLGLTNTGTSNIGYYASMWGSPSLDYVFSGPFDGSKVALEDSVYAYMGTTTVGGNSGVLPWINITTTVTSVPEPATMWSMSLLGVTAVAGAIVRRRRS